jgi:hypothetical protein
MSVAVVLSLGLAAPGWSQTIKEREKNQQKRIAEGVKSGELTKKEALKLEKKEKKLHEQIQKDRADGRGLTPKERAKIERKQDKVSRQIYKEKHDNQDRK